MSDDRINLLIYVDPSYCYINAAGFFIKYIPDKYQYMLFSQQCIYAEINDVIYEDIDSINQFADTRFDYVVIASDNPDDVFDNIEHNLKKHDYKVVTMLEAAQKVLSFGDYVNYLRINASTLIPKMLPSKVINERYRKYTNDMHIVMSFDSKFLLPAITTIYTLFLFNCNCHVHILYNDLKQNEMTVVERLTRLARGGTNKIEWHYVTNDLQDKIHFNLGRYSINILYKFLAYKILDESIERCLWLDSDLMIRGNVRDLYEVDMSDEYYFASALESSEYEDTALGKNREYTNIGVLLMNLKKIRSDDMIDKFWSLLFSPDFNYPTLEQDAMNIVFRYKIYLVKQEIWNSFPISDFSGVPEIEFDKIVDRTRIVHWLSAQKAWLPEYEAYWQMCGEEYPYAKIMFDEYKKRLNESVDFVSNVN